MTGTKPYIASGSYIRRMGDSCTGCPHDPAARVGPTACPFTNLYWNFLIRHEDTLRANPRMALNLVGLARITPEERSSITAQADRYLTQLEPWTGAATDPSRATVAPLLVSPARQRSLGLVAD